MLGDINAKLEGENIFKPTIGNESLHRNSNDNYVRSKNLFVEREMFRHRNIHKYTWTSHDVKTDIQFDHIVIHRRWHSSILYVRPFRGVDCDTYHCRLVAKVRD